MSLNFSQLTLSTYLEQLSRREPVPGGGSAAALTAALGAGLLSMVANYSIGRKSNTRAVDERLRKALKDTEKIRKRLLALATLDSKAYLKIVQSRHASVNIQKKASQQAAAVGTEVCRLSYQAMDLAPFMVKNGNPHLISDIEVAIELLHAGFNGSLTMVRINQ
jgi:methenyltetrahydrofolate cyclohydrolase